MKDEYFVTVNRPKILPPKPETPKRKPMTEDQLREAMMAMSKAAGTFPKDEEATERRRAEARNAHRNRVNMQKTFTEKVEPYLTKKPQEMFELEKRTGIASHNLRQILRSATAHGWCKKADRKIKRNKNYVCGYVRA